MRQAVHIFKKDLRGHWYEVAVALAVTVAFAFIGAKQAAFWRTGGENRDLAWELVMFILPLTWWALAARVIHSEALPGDRQFWLTRPYRRSSLLGAKALFLLTCVNLPMLLADAIVVGAYGFPISSMLPGLIWKQVLLTAVFILPIAALSALTTGLVQLVLTLSAIGVAMLAWTLAAPGLSLGVLWFGLEWVRTYFALTAGALAALSILLWQYARRKTAAARFLAAAAVILIALGLETIPFPAAFWIQSKFSKQRFNESGLQVRFATERNWAASVVIGTDSVRLNLPLALEGIPSNAEPSPEALIATFEAQDGTTWKAAHDPRTNVIFEGQLISLRTNLGKAFYEKVRDRPVTVHGTMYLTLFGNSRITRLPFRNESVELAGAGRCRATQAPTGQNYFLLCDSAFRAPKDSVWGEWVGGLEGLPRATTLNRWPSYSPFAADLSLNPIYQYSTYRALQGETSAVEVHTLEPLGYVQRDFEIKNLRLADFERH